jgi:site-specific DNA-methyltransferase (adenine-specific)
MIELLHGDCLELMKNIPDKSIDMILCDLPYGTTACKWDVVIPFEPLWKELKRIRKNRSAIILFGNEPFSSSLRMSNIKEYRYDIVWNKKKPSNFQMMNFQPGRIHEYIHIFSDSPAVYCNNKHMKYYPIKEQIEPYERKVSFYGTKNATLRKGHTIKELGPKIRCEKNQYYSIIEFTNANIKSKVHPTEKPVNLLEMLITTFSLKGETVLDFTMGSGSTGVACINTNRNFIGIEKDEAYFKIAEQRINARTLFS